MSPKCIFAVFGLLLGSLVAWQGGAQAASSPFAGMAGSWSGSGSLTTSAGTQERLRCRAAYNVGGGGDHLQLNLRCASDSYNFNLAGDVAHRNGAISGSWSESTRNMGGSVSGRASGEQIQVIATGGNFAASLSLTTRGNRQAVSIRSQGGDITGVSVSLAKR